MDTSDVSRHPHPTVRRSSSWQRRTFFAAVGLASLGLVLTAGGNIARAADADPTTSTTTSTDSTSTTVAPTTTTSEPSPTTVEAAVSGFTNNPDPQVIDSLTPEGDRVHVKLHAHTNFYCSLSGTTQFTLDGYLDPATGISTGTMDEVFTGTVVGAGTGTLRFAETFTGLADGSVTVDATVVSGTGDLATVTGTIHFVAYSAPTGEGSGSYTGTLQLPADPPASAPTTATCPSLHPVAAMPATAVHAATAPGLTG